ncbi:hypothetical protein V8C37DRAFT_384234 [Trichoderma ceciliae]
MDGVPATKMYLLIHADFGSLSRSSPCQHQKSQAGRQICQMDDRSRRDAAIPHVVPEPLGLFSSSFIPIIALPRLCQVARVKTTSTTAIDRSRRPLSLFIMLTGVAKARHGCMRVNEHCVGDFAARSDHVVSPVSRPLTGLLIYQVCNWRPANCIHVRSMMDAPQVASIMSVCSAVGQQGRKCRLRPTPSRDALLPVRRREWLSRLLTSRLSYPTRLSG